MSTTAEGKQQRRRTIRLQQFPEAAIDNFTRIDGAVEFYTRVGALIEPDMTVVDFGAGRGHWIADPTSRTRRDLRNFKGRVAEVIGVDVDEAVLDNPSLDRALLIGPDGRLPLPDASVDVIVSDFTFEHLPDPAASSAELSRVLKPGGWICARTPNKYGYIGLGARLVPNAAHTSWLSRLQPDRKEIDVFPVRYRLNTRRDLRLHFPDDRFDRLVYTYFGEPNYAGSSRLLWWLFSMLRRVQPRALDPMQHIFIHKRA